MTKKELIEELTTRNIGRDYSAVIYQPDTPSYKELAKRLKNISADLSRIPNAPVASVESDIGVIIYNLEQEIDELENPSTPDPIVIDSISELWKNHEPIVRLEKADENN